MPSRWQVLICLSCALGVASNANAGGFFRRVPEVGEWARYEVTQVHTSEPGKPDEHSQLIPGIMVVKCVGEEVIDERRCLWIETCYEMKPFPDLEFNSVTKVLVPADELTQGVLTNDFIRGWQSTMKGEPVEWTFSGDSDGGNAGEAAVTARMSSRTIIVNDEEIELTYSESSPMPTREDEEGISSGEMTIWPHDELGFGVASMDVMSLHRHLGDNPYDNLNETRYDLVETGTGAVSELPDHN